VSIDFYGDLLTTLLVILLRAFQAFLLQAPGNSRYLLILLAHLFCCRPCRKPCFSPQNSGPIHPSLLAILPRLQLVHDCWDLLNNQKEYYLPRGELEPDSAYKRRIDAALPSGFFRDALRTFEGMITASHWRELPPSLQAVVSDVDGLGRWVANRDKASKCNT